jgi:hypothetical protein
MPRFPYLSVIFLLLSALMVAVITPNAARILPPIEAFEANLSARFSSNVKIDGAVRLRFVPRPQIIIEQVSLSDRGRAAQFAATMPQMVINLDIIELVQRRFVVDEVNLIDADVQLQLAGSPAGLLAELHGETLPRVSLLDSDFRIIGLDPLRPQEVTRRDRCLRRADGEAGQWADGDCRSKKSIRAAMRRCCACPLGRPRHRPKSA